MPVYIRRKVLEANVKQRPAGYLDELMKAKLAEDAGGFLFDPKHPAWVGLFKQYGGRYNLKAVARDAGLVPAGSALVDSGEKPKPIDLSERGPQLWGELHRRPLDWPGGDDAKWLADFAARVPCGECRRHYVDYLRSNPPTFESPRDYFAWTYRLHCGVNEKLGKPSPTFDEACRLWGY